VATKPFRRWHVASQFIGVTFPIILLVVGIAAWMIHQHNISRLHDKLTKRAQSISLQVTADRDYYTKVVVPRLIEIGGSLGADYHQTRGQFPLPVTFVQEVSDQLVAKGGLFQSRLISPSPINQNKGLKDQFQREAFDYLRGNPTGQFFRLDQLEGRTVFRYMTADRATSQSCIDCHNNHPLSPRRDFKLNDVMGGLEVFFPADQYLQEDREDWLMMVAGGAGLCVMLMGLITLAAHWMITQPLARLSDHMDRRANKITGGLAIPGAGHIGGGNELLRFEAFFERMLTQIFSHQARIQTHEAALEVGNMHLQEQVERQARFCLDCEQRLRTVLDSANDAIIYIDMEGTIQWCNRKTEMLTGRPEADLVGWSVEAFLTPASFVKAKDRLASVQRGEAVPSRVEFELIKRTGELMRGEANIASVLEEGTVVGRVVVLRDITEQEGQQRSQ
jgi:PAS domain S-box-containing protein